ncbi:MAG: class IV adenylate cyclase [Acidobacteriia bacterium]|nr:class IV adenylate cyclase [Terriglobia bacterium]
MKVEIEIKLRLVRKLAEVHRELSNLGFRVRKRRVFESNILFDNVKRSLRKHGKLLRVRQVGRHGLLTFKGPSEQGRYKKRWETETPLHDGDAMTAILEHIGYHAVFRYEKFRTEYAARVGGIVLLDETPIGNFLELEGSPRWIDRTARGLGFSTADYINRSYGYLYLAYCRERRRRPKDMVFRNHARVSGQ